MVKTTNRNVLHFVLRKILADCQLNDNEWDSILVQKPLLPLKNKIVEYQSVTSLKKGSWWQKCYTDSKVEINKTDNQRFRRAVHNPLSPQYRLIISDLQDLHPILHPKNVKLGVYFIIICYISCQLLVPQTHNLEVPGSSPGWSTLKIKHLQGFCRCFFFCWWT